MTHPLLCVTCNGTGKVAGRLRRKKKCSACSGTGQAQRTGISRERPWKPPPDETGPELMPRGQVVVLDKGARLVHQNVSNPAPPRALAVQPNALCSTTAGHITGFVDGSGYCDTGWWDTVTTDTGMQC